MYRFIALFLCVIVSHHFIVLIKVNVMKKRLNLEHHEFQISFFELATQKKNAVK